MMEVDYPRGMYPVNLQAEMDKVNNSGYQQNERDSVISDLVRQNQYLISQLQTSNSNSAMSNMSQNIQTAQSQVQPAPQLTTEVFSNAIKDLGKEMARLLETNLQTRTGKSSYEEKSSRQDFQ